MDYLLEPHRGSLDEKRASHVMRQVIHYATEHQQTTPVMTTLLVSVFTQVCVWQAEMSGDLLAWGSVNNNNNNNHHQSKYGYVFACSAQLP